LVLAAKAIHNTLDAEQLFALLLEFLGGLYATGLNVVSFSSDGTEVEQSHQRLLVERADSQSVHMIQHPKGPFFKDIKIFIPVYKGHHIMLIQDSNHCRKTGKNNLTSGARLLVLGNYTAGYALMNQISKEPGSLLYTADVKLNDKQNDTSALRSFSADTLEFISTRYPNEVGEIMYLFIWGELVDAIQNRHITHIERIGMALRAYFFFQIWKAFKKKASSPTGRYFISPQAEDILNMVVHGLIGLVIITVITSHKAMVLHPFSLGYIPQKPASMSLENFASRFLISHF